MLVEPGNIHTVISAKKACIFYRFCRYQFDNLVAILIGVDNGEGKAALLFDQRAACGWNAFDETVDPCLRATGGPGQFRLHEKADLAGIGPVAASEYKFFVVSQRELHEFEVTGDQFHARCFSALDRGFKHSLNFAFAHVFLARVRCDFDRLHSGIGSPFQADDRLLVFIIIGRGTLRCDDDFTHLFLGKNRRCTCQQRTGKKL